MRFKDYSDGEEVQLGCVADEATPDAVKEMLNTHASELEKLNKRIEELEEFKKSVEEMPEYQHRI